MMIGGHTFVNITTVRLAINLLQCNSSVIFYANIPVMQ